MIDEQIGNYRIVRELGQGGMGQVFVAEHTILGHEVAVKLLHAKYLEDDEMRARFLNEARTIAKLKHPSIVDLFDFGYRDDGTGYIVMELLDGESLRERLSQGQLELGLAVELARQVAGALAAAHTSGVVHRDLKPDNIFLVDDPEARGGLRAIVLDFGLAKQVAVETADVNLTSSGFVVGTPAYMSPEQCRGERELDGRSDIYALGAVMYRMCVGRRPFDADNPGELLGQHLYVPAPAPRAIRPAIPEELERIIQCCLAKEPDNRFADARQLAEALDNLADTQRAPTAPVVPDLALSATEPAFVGRPELSGEAREPTAETAVAVAPEKPPTARVAAGVGPSSIGPPRWLWLVAGGLALAGGIALWGVMSSTGEPGPATSLAADAGVYPDAAAVAALDAAAADAAPTDAGIPDAIDAPRTGRELTQWVLAARARGDSEAGLAACQAGQPVDDAALSTCAVVACNVKARVAAYRYMQAIGSQSIRNSTANLCERVGIDVRNPPPMPVDPGRDDLGIPDFDR